MQTHSHLELEVSKKNHGILHQGKQKNSQSSYLHRKPKHSDSLMIYSGNSAVQESDRLILIGEDSICDEDQEEVKDFIDLENGFTGYSILKLFKLFGGLAVESAGIGLSCYVYLAVNLVGFYAYSHTGSQLDEAAYGIAIFFSTIFMIGVYFVVDEKVAMESSIALGRKDYQGVKRAFWQGLLTTLLLMVFAFIPMAYFSETIFVKVGFESNLARSTAYIVKWMTPFYCVMMINSLLYSVVLAQAVDHCYGLISAVCVTLSLITSTIVHVHFGYDGLSMWMAGISVTCIIMFIAVLPPFFRGVDPRTRGFMRLTDILDGYLGFLKDCLYFFVSTYSEWLATEITIYFVSLTHDNNQIIAFSSVTNISASLIVIGSGFCIKGRTIANILLGMNKRVASKKFFTFFLTGFVLLGVLISLLLYIISPQIIQFYCGDNKEAAAYFSTLLKIQLVFIPLAWAWDFIFSLARSVGETLFSILTNIVLILVACTAINVYLISTGKSCVEVFVVLNVLVATSILLMMARLLCLDWQRANLSIEI